MNVWWLQSLQCIGEQELRPISVPISVTEAEMCRQCLKFMKKHQLFPRLQCTLRPPVSTIVFLKDAEQVQLVGGGRE